VCQTDRQTDRPTDHTMLVRYEVDEGTKTKNGDTQKKRSSHKVRGVDLEAGRESMIRKICERGS